MSKFVITGGAGYIGGYMTIRLLQDGHIVKVIDKNPKNSSPLLSTLNDVNFSYLETDICNSNIESDILGFDTIIHLASNTNAQIGYKNPNIDFQQGIFQTFKILEAMNSSKIKRIIFSSSGTVYGNSTIIPTPESSSNLSPISIYGASKFASENLINAFCHMYNMKSWIFRIGNVIGKDCRKGVVFDLVEKLKKNPQLLDIMGDGEQSKDYVYIDDLIDAILYTYKKSNDKINLYNIGSDSSISVKEIAEIIIQEMKLNPKINYLGGPDGWKGGGWEGDVTKVHLDTSKLKKIGWIPKLSAKEIVKHAIKDIL